MSPRFYQRFAPARLKMLRAISRQPHRYRAFRLLTMSLTLAALFAVPGFGLARFDLFAGAHLALGRPVAPLYGLVAVSVAIFAAYFFTFQINLVAGRMFCGWGCPVGQINRLTDAVRSARGFRAKQGWGLVLLLFSTALSLSVLLWWVSPSAFLAWPAGLMVGGALVVLVGASLIFGRVFGWAFCRKACPIGLYYSVVQQKRPLGILFESANCVDEKACVKVCPVLLDPRDMLEPRIEVGGLAAEGLAANNHCLRCGACVEACELVTSKTGPVALRFGRPERAIEVSDPPLVQLGGLPAARTEALRSPAPFHEDDRGRISSLNLALTISLAVAVGLVALTITRGNAANYSPKRTWEQPAPPTHPKAPNYVAAVGPFPESNLEGRVIRDGRSISGALVHLDGPNPGLSLGPAVEIPIAFGSSGLDQAIYIGTTRDALRLDNRSQELHTISLRERGPSGRSVRNLPLVPAQASKTLPLPPAGEYQIACANHPSERASLIVVDHPYFAWTGPDGSFRLAHLPAGRQALVIDAPDRPRRRQLIEPSPNQTLRLDLTENASEEE